MQWQHSKEKKTKKKERKKKDNKIRGNLREKKRKKENVGDLSCNSLITCRYNG